jgi:ADP-ribosylglycohydrolase
VGGHTLATGIERARKLLKREEDSAETLGAIAQAMNCVEAGTPPDDAIPLIGEGWVAEEALGIALYCALTTRDFATAVRMAVNHDGDSDTTGSLVGQLLGARLGEAAIPTRWLDDLELRETIETLADDLASFLTWNLDPYSDTSSFTDRTSERYPGW